MSLKDTFATSTDSNTKIRSAELPATHRLSPRIRNIASGLFPVLFEKTGANLKESAQ